jgi:hypothetical protein
MNSNWEVLAEVGMENAGNVDVNVNNSSNNNVNVNADSIGLKESQVFMCWRPDGTLCAISSVDASDSVRKIRIYERETLTIHAVGRTEDGSGKLVPNL